MSVSIIPFKMPEPMAIPEHIIANLQAMFADEAVKQGMELLMQIDAAETMIHERVGEGEKLELVQVVGARADELAARLEKEECYGQPLAEENSLAQRALAGGSALLVMGNAEAGEQELPAGLAAFLLEGEEEGNIGFLYVLPLVGEDGRPLGALTLIRSAADGPLNHEQPNLAEGMRRELSAILGG